MHDVVEKVLVSEEDIVKRSMELGKQISDDYRKTGKAPLLVALLKGSVPFLAELIKHIDLDIQFDFMDVSVSYTHLNNRPLSLAYAGRTARSNLPSPDS